MLHLVDQSVKRTPEEVHELIEEMTANMYQYPLERSSKKAAGICILDSSTTIQTQLEALQQQVASLQQKSNPVVASICGICGGGHANYECPDSCRAKIEEVERIEEVKEGGLIHSEEKEDEDPIRTREVEELEAKNKEELEEEIKEKGAQEAPKPELKPLPNNLKYVFLEENDKPVIISSCLTGLEEKMLIEVLSKHKKAIG
ncbi:hypothetical protein H6P81_016238 [Aristolochia fimbriata]|uniref:Uncharacterized protein n=1 Tax=Aristolochia fimbriata TaxID=158543 RepID=A0AAV7E864_ARIFI|nr:hypothetical protein H6P81_016238 [Aristolochia fimbriata]